MKAKIFTLFSYLFMLFALSAQDVNEIRPVEGAFVGFFQPNEAPLMKNVGNGVFEWVGKMKPGAFTFTVNCECWDNRIYSSTANEEVVIGQTHDIVVSFNGSAPDLKFEMKQPEGWYKITIDINELTMMVESSTMTESVYEIRPAEGAFSYFFEPSVAAPMENKGNGIFQWTGKMKPGTFTFTVNGASWTNRIYSSTADEEIVLGQAHDIILSFYGSASDLKFKMPESATEGWYKITIDLNDFTMTIENGTLAESVYEIHPVESAFVGFSEPTDAPAMDNKGNGIFEWTGKMKPGVFTFAINGTAWTNRIYSTVTDEEIVLGATHDIALSFNSSAPDQKFVMPETTAGWYKITININEMNMIVAAVPVSDLVYEIYPAEGAFVDFSDPADAPAMENKGNGIFEWIGKMKPGAFTFTVNGTEWENRIYSTVADEEIVPGTEHDIILSLNDSEPDLKFKMPETTVGWYKIIIDLNEMNMIVSAVPVNELVYEIHPAEDAFIDFSDPADAPAMENKGTGIFELITRMKPGVFTFTVNGTGWENRIYSTLADEEITLGTEHNIVLSLNNSEAELKFKMPETTIGWYKITIDLNEMNMIVSAVPVSELVYEIHPAEDAFVDFSDPADAPAMENKGNGIFEWTGKMKPGKFTFTINGTAWANRIYSTEADEEIGLGTEHNIVLSFNSAEPDLKFEMKEPEDWYKMTINLNTMTLIIQKTNDPTTIVFGINENQILVILKNGCLNLFSKSSSEISNIMLYDISGKKTVSFAGSVQEIAIPTTSLNKGFYILQYKYDNKVLTEKLLID